MLGVAAPQLPARRLQHQTADRRTRPLRPRTARQGSLPQGRRRLGRRLPRGLHDRRPESARTAGAGRRDPQKPPGLRRTAGDGTFITTPSTCLGEGLPGPSGTSTPPTCGPTPTPKRKPGYSSRTTPTRASSRRSRPGPSRKNASTIPYRPVARSRPRHRPRPTRPPAPRSTSRCRTSSAAATRTAPTPAPRGSRCRSGWDSTPPRPPGLQTCSDAQFGKGTSSPVRLPGRLEDRHGRDRDAAAARRLADRQRLPRPAAQPRPGLRQRVPDLRRRRVAPLRGLGAADRQRQRRPADGPADRGLRRQPAGRRSARSSSSSTAAQGRR